MKLSGNPSQLAEVKYRDVKSNFMLCYFQVSRYTVNGYMYPIPHLPLPQPTWKEI